MLTYAELETKRLDWLKANGNFCQELVQLAATLGTRLDDMPPGWQSSEHYIYVNGDVKVDTISYTGNYVSSGANHGDYVKITKLRVFAGKYQPVYRSILSDKPGTFGNADWFVPGDWMLALAGPISEMQEVLKKVENAALDNEAAILEKRLLIGVPTFGEK